MSIITKFIDHLNFIKKNEKIKKTEVYDPEISEQPAKSLFQKKEIPLLEGAEEKILGLYSKRNLFIILKNILKNEDTIEKYALERIINLTNNSYESVVYYSEYKQLEDFWFSLNYENKKLILDYMKFVEEMPLKEKQKNTTLYIKSIFDFFQHTESETVDKEIKNQIERTLLSLLKTNLDLKKFDNIQSYSFKIKYLPEHFNVIVYDNFSMDEKVKYANSILENAIKNNKRFLGKDFYIYKENMPLYIDYIKLLNKTTKQPYYNSEIIGLKKAGVYLNKEYISQIYPENKLNKLIEKEEDLFLGLTNSLFSNNKMDADKRIELYMESVEYIKENIKKKDNLFNNNLQKFIYLKENFFNNLEQLEEIDSLKLLNASLKTISELKEISMTDSTDYMSVYLTQLMEIIKNQSNDYKKSFVINCLKNEKIDAEIKNTIFSKVIDIEIGYFNIGYDLLEEYVSLYKLCCNDDNYDKNALLNQLFSMSDLNNGYKYHDFKKSELMLSLAFENQEVSENIIYCLIKFNAMYKKEDEGDEKTLEDYKKLKDAIHSFITRKNIKFSMNDIMNSRFFEIEDLNPRTIIDFNEFDTNHELKEALLKDEQYMELYQKNSSPMLAYNYAKVKFEKSLLFSKIVESEDSIKENDNANVIKRKRL